MGIGHWALGIGHWALGIIVGWVEERNPTWTGLCWVSGALLGFTSFYPTYIDLLGFSLN
ncbi:MAG: hypothetical protein QQW96_20995 [Tychonema bourrellyi B0820]|uniref:hypothetical protein n=1 Tax=Tychonema bourrellyi TaxID=54313 RepID=UPI0015D488DB|nr:hypothetical protein [Tychonema bourrellyi]MDQ2100113.1 hypothetical protein [Tychonema bourrellyi B0820]